VREGRRVSVGHALHGDVHRQGSVHAGGPLSSGDRVQHHVRRRQCVQGPRDVYRSQVRDQLREQGMHQRSREVLRELVHLQRHAAHVPLNCGARFSMKA
jgi:hypothetical protein